MLDGRRIALLERFTVDGWTAAVREHRPKTVSLVPTALRMVLDADVDDDVFTSIRSVVSGTAPLDPDLAEAFTDRYGVPVLTSYGATEFGGGVAGWNLADHEEFAAAKRGSVGRAHAGCSLRVVDPDDGRDLGIDTVGLLEVRAAQLGTADWVRTTDLARLDADGFLWIVGRADQTILRGGYKVQPEVVRAALERVDGVAEAAVVGVPDERLGAVPVAAVEPQPDATLDEATVLAAVGAHLARYEMPVSVTVVDALPRTASGKADLAAVRDLIASSRSDGRERRQGAGCSASRRCPPWWSWRVRCATSPTPCSRSSTRRRSSKRWCRRCATRSNASPPRRRPISARASATTRRPIGACTSTTATASATTTRASRSTRSSSTDAATTVTTARTARSSSRSATRDRRGSCTGGSSRCSSTACSRSSTARSVSRARPPSCPSGSGVPHRCSRRSRIGPSAIVDDRRITGHAELLLGDDLLCEAHLLAAKGDRAALPATSPRRP